MNLFERIMRPIGPRPGERIVEDQTRAWPAVKAVRGKYYIFTDPHGDKMVAQTQDTWEALGTVIEQQRLTMRGQDTCIKQQSDEIRRLSGLLDDARNRLENLRGNHRALLKERVEAGMAPADQPGFNIFSTPKKD
jgi:hypothetical protein